MRIDKTFFFSFVQSWIIGSILNNQRNRFSVTFFLFNVHLIIGHLSKRAVDSFIQLKKVVLRPPSLNDDEEEEHHRTRRRNNP